MNPTLFFFDMIEKIMKVFVDDIPIN